MIGRARGAGRGHIAGVSAGGHPLGGTQAGGALPASARLLPAAASERATSGHRSARSIGARAGLTLVLGSGVWLGFAAASDDRIVDTASAPEPAWARGLLAGVLPALSDLSFSLLMLSMLAGYVVALSCAERLPRRATLAVVAGLIVVFGLAPPLLSSDLFGYIAYARLDVLHAFDPYVHAPSAAPHDAVFPFVFWQDQSSPYGPLFTLLSLPLGGVSLPVAVWSLKALGAVATISAVLLVARAAPAYGRSPQAAALVVGANPLLLVYGVGGGHNDLVVMAVAAAAILLLADGRGRMAGGAALVCAAGLKLTGGLLAPFALVAGGGRRRLAAGGLAAGAVTAALAVIAFGTAGGGTIGQIATNGQFVIDWSGPEALGRLLGTGVTTGVRLACAAGAAAVFSACLLRVRLGADWLAMSALAGLAVMCAIPSLVPWYVAWVLPAAALARGRAAVAGVAAVTVVMLVTRLPALGFTAY